jgi:hypothetical protein
LRKPRASQPILLIIELSGSWSEIKTQEVKLKRSTI